MVISETKSMLLHILFYATYSLGKTHILKQNFKQEKRNRNKNICRLENLAFMRSNNT